MKKFKVWWTEKHSKYVEAENEDLAFRAAAEEMTPSCDYQTIDLIEEKESHGND